MEESALQKTLREELGLRVGSEMAAYIARQAGQTAPVPVIAGDARTGAAVRRELSAETVRALVERAANP